MSEPTQAQIEAALDAFYQVPSDTVTERIKAALTAAAQVGNTKELGKYIQTITPSIAARERERTIERCAQVADELAKVEYAEYEEAGNKLAKAAAAIRALKE